MCGNKGFWKSKICISNARYSQEKWIKEYGAPTGLENRVAGNELLVYFSRSIFTANCYDSEWGAALYEQNKTTMKTTGHNAIG